VTETWEEHIVLHRNRHDTKEIVAKVVILPIGKGTRDQEKEKEVTMDAVT
jgi:hypothetical protein